MMVTHNYNIGIWRWFRMSSLFSNPFSQYLFQTSLNKLRAWAITLNIQVWKMRHTILRRRTSATYSVIPHTSGRFLEGNLKNQTGWARNATSCSMFPFRIPRTFSDKTTCQMMQSLDMPEKNTNLANLALCARKAEGLFAQKMPLITKMCLSVALREGWHRNAFPPEFFFVPNII